MFLFPPRPENKITPSLIRSFEDRGYVGQIKKNGTCSVVATDGDGNVSWKTRTGDDHKAWKPTDELNTYFSKFRHSVFVGELLHSKGPSVKNTIYLFDVLVYLGRDLTGTTLEDRHPILRSVIPISDKIRLVENHYQDLTGLFFSLKDPLDEGLVLKNPKALLRDCRREGLNSAWQVKCRKQTLNYGF